MRRVCLLLVQDFEAHLLCTRVLLVKIDSIGTESRQHTIDNDNCLCIEWTVRPWNPCVVNYWEFILVDPTTRIRKEFRNFSLSAKAAIVSCHFRVQQAEGLSCSPFGRLKDL